MKNAKNMMLAVLTSVLIAGCGTAEVDSESPEAKKAMLFYQQGTQELIGKNYTQALTYLLKAKELDSGNDQIRNNLGMAYYLKGQAEKAKAEFDKALSINPKNSDARNNYASILFEQKKYKEALKEYIKVTEDLTYNRLFRVYYNMGLIYNVQGNEDQAKEFFDKSVADKNDYCPAHYQLGQYYTQKYKYNDALSAYKESIKGTCVNEPASHFELGLTLQRLNRLGEAELKFKEIMEKFPKNKFSVLAKEELSKIADENEIAARAKVQRKSTEENNSFETPNF